MNFENVSRRAAVINSIKCVTKNSKCPANPKKFGIQWYTHAYITLMLVRPQSVDSWDGGFFTRVFAAVGW